MVAVTCEGTVGHGGADAGHGDAGDADADGVVDAGVEDVHHRGRDGGHGLDDGVVAAEVVFGDGAVGMRHGDVAGVGEVAGGAGAGAVEAVGYLSAADEYGGTRGGVDGGEDDACLILSAAHDHAALGDDEGVEAVDAHVAGVELRDEVLQGFALGIEDVVLELGEEGDGGHDGLVVKLGVLPLGGRELSGAADGGGAQRLLYVLDFVGVGDKAGDELAETVHAKAQFLALARAGGEHHDRCGLEVVAADDVVGVAVGAVGLADDGEFEGVDKLVHAHCLAANLRALAEPGLTFLGVLHGEGLELAVEGGVSAADVGVGAVEALMHLREAVQDVAGDVQGKHGRQDDIHQVYHLLTGRQSVYVFTHGWCGRETGSGRVPGPRFSCF